MCSPVKLPHSDFRLEYLAPEKVVERITSAARRTGGIKRSSSSSVGVAD
jgi:hypothetical protein